MSKIPTFNGMQDAVCCAMAMKYEVCALCIKNHSPN